MKYVQHLTIATILAAYAGIACSDELKNIIAFNDSTVVLHADPVTKERLAEVNASELSPLPLSVKEISKNGFLKVLTSKGVAWIDPLDAQLDSKLTVSASCDTSTISLLSDRASKGANGNTDACKKP